MPRPREVIELAERVLDLGISERSAIEQVALQYADVVNGIHARVRQALECARRGLRMEVRSIADARPPLVETAALFVTPQAEKWREYCIENFLSVPPRIARESIAELQESLNALLAHRFEELHAVFRHQNLAFAPIHQRLRTLRLIAKRDRGNPVWSEDIERFEIEAITELRGEFVDALGGHRLSAAAEILETLRGEEWERAEAKQRAVQWEIDLWSAQAHEARIRAGELAKRMHENYMAESVELVRANLAEWGAIEATLLRGKVAIPLESAAVVAPIIAWMVTREVAEQLARETQSQLYGLERAVIDGKSSADDIQTRLVTAEKLPGGVPGDLRAIAERRVGEHTASLRRGRLLKFVGAGALVAAILGAAILWRVQVQQQADRDQFAAALVAAVDRGDDAQVERLLEQMRAAGSDFAQDPAVLRAMKTRSDRQTADSAQDAQFDAAVVAAGDPTAAQAVSAAIEPAAKLARTDEQRGRVQGWRVAQSAASVRAQQARDDAFLAEVKQFAAGIDELERAQSATPEAAAQLSRLESHLARIELTPSIGKEARVAFDTQRNRLTNAREIARRETDQHRNAHQLAQDLAELLTNAKDPLTLPAALEAFADKHPDSPFALDFREAQGQASLWKPIVDWRVQQQEIIQTPFPADAAERAALVERLRVFRESHSASVFDGALLAYAELLVDGKVWIDWLRNTLRSWTPLSFKMILLDTGERYYYEPAHLPKPSTTPGVDVYAVIASWKDHKMSFARIDRARIKSDGPSPQALLRDRIEPLVRGVNAQPTAERAFAILKMIRDDNAVDPVARLFLLEGFLAALRSGIPDQGKAFDRAVTLLKEEDLEAVEWIAPGDPSKRRDFKHMQELIAAAIPVAQWERDHAAQVTAVTEWIASTMRPIGIIDRIAKPPTLLIALGTPLSAGERLYVVVGSPSQAASVVEIGSVQPDLKTQLIAERVRVPSGTVVFAGKWAGSPMPLATETVK